MKFNCNSLVVIVRKRFDAVNETFVRQVRFGSRRFVRVQPFVSLGARLCD